MSNFTKSQNLSLLWNVLLDELHIDSSNKSLISKIKMVFESNISPFVSRANPQTPLMDLNKQFLSQVVLAVNRLFPKQEQNIKRITITDEEVSDPYKIEDIQTLRQANFERELDQKRTEMEIYMTPHKPKDLDFSDKNSESKIKAMDSLVAEKMAQRNYDLEQIQNVNYNTSSIDPEKWLTPKETSVKNDKATNSKINLSIEPKNTKKVTWDDLHEPPLNIFNKLKKQTIPTIDVDAEKETQYVEQQSMRLPDVKQEEIKPIVTNVSSNNEPILPKSEIIKQLNEMNKKIDALYDMIVKLTSKSEITLE